MARTGPRLRTIRRLGTPLPGLTRKSAGRRPCPPGVHGLTAADLTAADWTGEIRGRRSPDIDILDRPNEILVRADLPGLEQKDIDATVDTGILRFRGERKGEQETKDEDCERWAGRFTRSLSLAAGTDPNQIRGTFKNGVLEIHISKTQEATGKRIEIKAA